MSYRQWSAQLFRNISGWNLFLMLQEHSLGKRIVITILKPCQVSMRMPQFICSHSKDLRLSWSARVLQTKYQNPTIRVWPCLMQVCTTKSTKHGKSVLQAPTYWIQSYTPSPRTLAWIVIIRYFLYVEEKYWRSCYLDSNHLTQITFVTHSLYF